MNNRLLFGVLSLCLLLGNISGWADLPVKKETTLIETSAFILADKHTAETPCDCPEDECPGEGCTQCMLHCFHHQHYIGKTTQNNSTRLPDKKYHSWFQSSNYKQPYLEPNRKPPRSA